MKKYFNLIIALFLITGTINAQNINQQFFDEADAFFKQQVQNGLVDYTNLKTNAQLKALIKKVATADISKTDNATLKAFYINAYNLHVINAAAQQYPIKSVQEISGFFERRKVTVAGVSSSLNVFEKGKLLKPFKDPRLHFVLVCGALGCPPITNFAYRPDQLDAQLEQQTKLALNDSNFIRVTAKGVELSQIFKWYSDDFGGTKKTIFNFINKYRSTAINQSASVSYYTYDWSINKKGASTSGASSLDNNTARYIVSSTIPKGSIETKIFNNLYTQQTGSEGNLTDRATFFTTTVSFLYGLNSRLNIGFNTRYRRVRNAALPSSPLSVFSTTEEGNARQGFTAFGPQIRYAPVEKWQNFSIQSSFVFPIGNDLTGSETQPYIDWSGATWNTQLFNDISIGSNFSLFTELDFLLEDIGFKDGRANRFSTPATLIFSYNPNRKTTLYTLGGFSPYWQTTFDYFIQGGVGAKYQFTPNLELELLYTGFSNRFLAETGGRAATYNIGFRFNL